MVKVTLGSTGITVNKNGFGALPIQRISSEASAHLLRKAYEAGIDFYDTARFYTDSEEKIGEALSDVRDNIYIATKTAAQNSEDFWKDLATSLNNLKTDYIDIYQFHNPSFCPKPCDGTGLYEAMLEAKAQGKIRHIGITNHRLNVAMEALESGLYETLQFPFNYLATEKEHKLVEVCREKNIGFIAMKALSGGLITNSKVAYAYQEKAMKALSEFLRPEFLARVDEILVFRDLDENDFKKISALLLDEYVPTLKEKGITFKYDDKACTALAEKAKGGKSGARDLRNIIRKEVEDKIAEEIIDAGNTSLSGIAVTAEDNKIKLEVM